MGDVQIAEAYDGATVAQASNLLRLAGFARAADELAADGINPEFELLLIASDDELAPVGMVWGKQPSRVLDDDAVWRTSALLSYVAVHPARRRLGIGSALVEAFCDRSRDGRADVVVLHFGMVGPERAAELTRFYLANGFVAGDYGLRRELVH
ncbi:GNAT family N-acetyltransferase [Cellulomonas sp. H30R-01]|uniref:GNAT family N-acetyltransferase n=1 Tax=Cellulomonas sp. H30R-01 TaxID=2704467 RepID=UPI00138D1D36|nr:GNAT family N-acetyltransferase [Cellulomonas sp. H30R-01]QHT56052.1 GNAT family N-acetyltransferase [Cellulomonas sp. H30R-01]